MDIVIVIGIIAFIVWIYIDYKRNKIHVSPQKSRKSKETYTIHLSMEEDHTERRRQSEMTQFQKSIIDYFGIELKPFKEHTEAYATERIIEELGEIIYVQILLASMSGDTSPENIDRMKDNAVEFQNDSRAMVSLSENFIHKDSGFYHASIRPIIPGQDIRRNTKAYWRAEEILDG